MTTASELASIRKAVKIGVARSVIGTYGAVDAMASEDVQKATIPRQQIGGGPALDHFAINFCKWCNDFAEHPIACSKCHHKICTAQAARQSGCLHSDTIPKGEVFTCPDCSDSSHHVS
jgi:hypothetical protein